MIVARWVPAAPAAEIAPGSGRRVVVDGGFEVAVYNEAGRYFALDDTCPHQGASLGQGTLHEGRVICPWHNWMFDVRTGECLRTPGVSVRCFPARLSDGVVEVEIP